MRDILVTVIVFGLIPYILARPQVGIYTWSWLSYMNPHRLAYGFAYTMPFAQIVAIASLLSILIWKEPKRVPVTGLTVLWVVFLIWMLLTTAFAMFPELAWPQYERIIKIQLVTFLTMMVIRTHKEINILIWVIALSVGFFGIKGGLFTLQSLGGYRVWGPPGSFIEENNALAVALLMVLPLFYYLRLQSKRLIVRQGLLTAMLLIVISVIGSQSRGALLAICATGFFLWLKTPGKILSGLAMLLLAIGIYSFMPERWHDRMGTITNYQEDSSAMGRITAWKLSINVANHRPLGGGLELWQPTTYRIYSQNPEDAERETAAHSIYFSVLGEHGWIGLIMFLAILLIAWRTASKIITLAKD
ncbi:MAG: putative O-glycosylation ligase, exosortase A system-associated, partial [Pseudomonadales bacterium]|nr:putative O-glycosylation ligase, exosortase A system-associated [Pseudomonadales bacterium]